MSIAKHHTEWLSLIEISGPFLSMPVLMRVFPQGLNDTPAETRRELRLAYEEWRDNQFGLQPAPAIHHAWIRYALKSVLEFPADYIAAGQAIPPTIKASIAEQGETLRPDMIILDPDASRQDAKAQRKEKNFATLRLCARMKPLAKTRRRKEKKKNLATWRLCARF